MNLQIASYNVSNIYSFYEFLYPASYTSNYGFAVQNNEIYLYTVDDVVDFINNTVISVNKTSFSCIPS